ncbi:unnamed protein product [Somion occarium]|uniref:Uncharacterized protein n=1 Tax=Somion occarium TaxID=3059160 RepID=A0ABP1D2E0_9APHY
MSISVDDLVASLGANHIGQEAIDLAALQLSQALPKHTGPTALDMQKVHHGGYTQPYNTPTNRTPSTSFSFEHARLARSRSCSVASRNARPESISEVSQELGYDDDRMDEDERMVDEMLFPSSPVSACSYSTHFPSNDHSFYPRSFQTDHPISTMHSPHSMEYGEASPTSTFANTDPFYLAQLQASQASTSASHFAFLGSPAQQSPFVPSSRRTRGSSIGRVSTFPGLTESSQTFALSAAAR